MAMWATPTDGSSIDDAADCRTIVPMLSGINLGVSDYTPSMERQCAFASRVNHQAHSPYVTDSYRSLEGYGGNPYYRSHNVDTAGTTRLDYYNGAHGPHSSRDSSDVRPPYAELESLHHVTSSLDSGQVYNIQRYRVDTGLRTSSSSSPVTNSKESRVCGVCGDRALGYNFDAISCESCKAFFRRNAPKGLEHFKCAYDYLCKMDLSNRRFCKRCRLGKCFQIGMRREYILTDDERAVKRQKIVENRLKRRGSGTGTSSASDSASSGQSSSSSPGSSRRVSTVTVIASAEPQYDVMSGALPIESSTSNVVTSQTVALEPTDAAAIDELVMAYRDSLRVKVDSMTSQSCNDELTQYSIGHLRSHSAAANMSDLVNIAELSVRRVIAMAKQMRAFRLISHDDQIQLLKGGSIELLILRSVLTFDKDKQQFLDPLDHEETAAMKVEQLRHAEQGTDLFEDHMAFVRSLTLELNVDETTLILLLVIALFSPDRERLQDRQLIADEQERYTVLLKLYLESILPESAAKCLFPKLLHKLADVRNLNEKHSLVLLKVNPVGIQPLMKEVLDIDR